MNKFTALLTDEQIRRFYDENTITVKFLDGNSREEAPKKVKFNICINGKTYNFGKTHNVSLEDLENQALTLYCYDFGCDFRIPNLDPESVVVEEIKEKYIKFMTKAMREISPEVGKEYAVAKREQRWSAKKESSTIFSI